MWRWSLYSTSLQLHTASKFTIFARHLRVYAAFEVPFDGLPLHGVNAFSIRARNNLLTAYFAMDFSPAGVCTHCATIFTLMFSIGAISLQMFSEVFVCKTLNLAERGFATFWAMN